MTDVKGVTVEPAVAVVLPAFDELPNLRELIPEIEQNLQEATSGHHSIYVAIEANPDPQTVDELRRLGAIPIKRGPTNSFGDAIRSGISSVDGHFDYIIIMDADGSHRPSTIPRLIAAANMGDVIVASRYVAGGTTANGPVLKAMSRALNLGYRYILGLKCSDVSTNFKLYRRTDLQSIDLQCQAFDIVEEILFRIRKLRGSNFTIHEIPDHFAQRSYGTTKRQLGPFIIAYFVTLFRLRTSREP